MVIQRAPRSMEYAEEHTPEPIRDWREGRSWWRQESGTAEDVRNLLLNDYKADDVPQEFIELYSGERYAACVAFKQGIIRWADNSFSEEYLDIVKKLSEGLSQGLPELGPLR